MAFRFPWQRVEDPAEQALLAAIGYGGSSFRRVVFTRNRRVLVSVGDRGRTLRLNGAFQSAPVEVLHALGTLLAQPSNRGARDAARRVVSDFLRHSLQSGSPTRRPTRRGHDDEAQLRRLQAEFDRVNGEFFDGALPAISIAISGRLRRRNGSFSSNPLEIVISRALCKDAELGEAEKTLRHEMIHLWQHHFGRPLGHGADFRGWALTLGVHPRATRDVAWKREAA